MASVMLRLQSKPGIWCAKSEQFLATICRLSSTTAVDTTQADFPVIRSEPVNLAKGTGGRSSFSGKVVTIFGASGLLGRAVVNQFGKIGTKLTIAYRQDLHVVKHLKLAGDLGQVHFQHFYLKDEDSILRAMQYSDVVVNLIGRHYETSNFKFEDVHVKGARNIARAARKAGVKTLIHVSALNACENPKPIILRKGSQFLASKWRGEQAVREEFPEAVIFRPSDMFGPNDNFCCYYGRKLRHTINIIGLWNKGKDTVKQPVYFSDVGKGIVRSAFDPHAAGVTYQAVGPHRYQLYELMQWFHRVMKYEKRDGYALIDLRYDLFFWMKVLFSEAFFTRRRLLSWERTEREYVTDVVDPSLPTLEDLGVELTTLEARIFYELLMFRKHAYRDPMLQEYIVPVDPAPLAK